MGPNLLPVSDVGWARKIEDEQRRLRLARYQQLYGLLASATFGEHDGGTSPVIVQEAAKHLRMAFELLRAQSRIDLLEGEIAAAEEEREEAGGC